MFKLFRMKSSKSKKVQLGNLIWPTITIAIALFAMYETVRMWWDVPQKAELEHAQATLNQIVVHGDELIIKLDLIELNHSVEYVLEDDWVTALSSGKNLGIPEGTLMQVWTRQDGVHELAGLSHEKEVLLGYEEYLELKKQEINSGPLSAALVFVGISILFLLLILLLPILKDRETRKVDKAMQRLPTAKLQQNGDYIVDVHGVKIRVRHCYSLRISEDGNYNYLMAMIEIPPDVRAQWENLIVAKYEVERDNGKLYVTLRHDMPFTVRPKKFVVKVEKLLAELRHRGILETSGS